MGGYRNRMVHFRDQITVAELYRMCSEELDDVVVALASIVDWIARHPERVEGLPDEGDEEEGD